MTEAQLSHYCMQRLKPLEIQGKCYFFRNNSFTGKLTRYNGSQGYVKNGKPGMPDIVACFIQAVFKRNDEGDLYGHITGQFIGFELKTAKGKQSDEQKKAQKMIEKLGGLYYLIRSPEDFEAALKELLWTLLKNTLC